MATSKKNLNDLDGLIEATPPLSNAEEMVFRIRQGASVDPDVPLERKTENPSLLARLLELERDIIQKAAKRQRTR